MKKILNVILCFMLVICISGCARSGEVTTAENKNEVKAESKEYVTYNFGDLIDIKASDDITISGNVIENGEDYVVILQTDANDNPVVSWNDIERELAVLKGKWTNVKDVRLMSIDVLLNNLTLSGNDIGNGYSGHRDEEDSFLYSFDSVQSYWVADSPNAKGSCYETAGCAWAVFKPYVEKVTVNNRINLRPEVEVSKDYVVIE